MRAVLRKYRIVSADEARRRLGLDMKWKNWCARAKSMSGDISFDDDEIVNAYKYFTADYTPFQFVEALSVGDEI